MITLKTIAEEAGVSQVTVSNVIHQNYKKVSTENIEKINAIIQKYNYVPNANARSLALKKSMLIGIVIPNVGPDDNFLKSPYNAEMVGVLEKVIRENGYYTMIRCVNDATDAVPLILTWNVDGVIFLGANSNDIPVIKQQLSLPVMFVDAYSRGQKFSNIGVDDEKGGYLATKYLINRGHKKISFVAPDIKEEGVIRERYLGYERAMKESNLEQECNHIFAKVTSYECGVELGKNIAFSDDLVTAIFATADILALGLIEGLRLSGKNTPDDISVIGFDNLPEGQYAWPKLTTVTQNIPLKAEVAAQALIKMVQDKEYRTRIVHQKVDVEVVERNSVKSIN